MIMRSITYFSNCNIMISWRANVYEPALVCFTFAFYVLHLHLLFVACVRVHPCKIFFGNRLDSMMFRFAAFALHAIVIATVSADRLGSISQQLSALSMDEWRVTIGPVNAGESIVGNHIIRSMIMSDENVMTMVHIFSGETFIQLAKKQSGARKK